jgi:carotenoid cleavage dioxygenase-like enzyme
MPPSAHPFLTGNLGPISSEDDFELQVRGSIPAELEGTFYRNGPNPQFVPETGYHPFLGDGLAARSSAAWAVPRIRRSRACRAAAPTRTSSLTPAA